MFGVIIGIDIKDFSKTARTDEMLVQREKLVTIINEGVADIAIYKNKKVLDTGDGCYILIDSGDYEKVLLGLKKIQVKAKEQGTLKFRGIVHIGKFEKTGKIFEGQDTSESYVGEGINEASRYLDAQCLKDMLKMNNQNFVWGISNEMYSQVFDQQYHVEKEYARYVFKTKEYSNQIFLNVIDIDFLPGAESIAANQKSERKNISRQWY
jgi:predicted aspartyl protease